MDLRTSVAIVGGGYAGLAAAVELIDLGMPVTVYEAARELGGRARRVERHGVRLDNGQHILIGAYVDTLSLMRRVGVPASSLLRLPLQWRFPPHFELDAVRAPAPWHLALGLLKARGMSLTARLRCAAFLHWCKGANFRLSDDRPVSMLLQEHKQDPAATRFLWEPLCVAALNTPPGEASAQIFLNVLKDGLAAGRAASELLLPAVDLTSLFPGPAADHVLSRGGEVHTGCAVQRVDRDGAGFTVTTAAERRRHRAVIIATAPQHVHSLVGHLDELSAPLGRIAALAYQPIVTVYLHYPRRLQLPAPMLGLSGRYGQWLFDRARIADQDRLVSVVISARARNERLAREELAARVHDEIAPLLGSAAAPDWVQVIEEKRATFSCVPNLLWPEQRTAIAGLCLAGDYTAGDYPATIEAAIRSGRACARLARAALHA